MLHVVLSSAIRNQSRRPETEHTARPRSVNHNPQGYAILFVRLSLGGFPPENTYR